ncbi:ATP-binding protein [Pleomorphomonas sp. PLEO]|uniref:ATP-binding protein n=1 Tax=Pleomorphomonas sp. PLEO TaxID=3239306 RepID=UPI00351DE113
MSGGADLFKVLSHAENVVALIADTRPAVVVDRTGGRLLWANAAGAAFFGVATVEKLTALRFSAASPFARRIAMLDNTLASGQDRIERLPLQRGLLPRPTVCKASRVLADGIKAILLTIVDGTGSLPSDPAAAFAALAATSLPEAAPEPAKDLEAVAEEIVPEAKTAVDNLAGTGVAEPIEAAPEEAAIEPVAESGETIAETVPSEAADVIGSASEEVPPTADEIIETEISFAPIASISANAEEIASEAVEAVTEEAPAEPVETTIEEALPEAVEAVAEEAPADPVETTIKEALPEAVEAVAEEAPADPVETTIEEALPEAVEAGTEEAPADPVETTIKEALPETVEAAAAIAEEASPELGEEGETPVEEAAPETVEVLQATTEPAFIFPAHGRAVRFVFELNPQLAFTFVSADLAQTVGPGMADILGRSWTDVAGRLEFDPVGRIAEALGRRDTFTGLTVDWPVEGENLRVPADLAGMPVFGRERSFRGYRGFGVLKTGAAFEAPVPAEPIALSEPDESVVLPPVQGSETASTVTEQTEPATPIEMDAVSGDQTPALVPEIINDLPMAGEAASDEVISVAIDQAVEKQNLTAEPREEPSDIEPAYALEDTAVETTELPDAPAEIIAATEHLDPLNANDAVESEEPSVDASDETEEVVPEAIVSEPPVSIEHLTSEEPAPTEDEPAETVPESALSPSAGGVEDEPVVAEEEPAEADELPEPLPLVTPPPESDMADVAESEPPVPSVAEVVSSPSTTHRTFASLTGDKARALSKPERDAFDKIAEALADAFGPRLLAEQTDRTVAPQVPVIARKTEGSADIGASVDIALLDKLPVALAILRGGDIIHANRAFLELCGYSDVAAIDADGGFAQVFEGSALNRDAANPAIRRRDGVEIPVSARLHSMPLEGGIASLLVVQETVATTSRDRLATAEQRAEDMEAILDTATDGVLVLDHKGLVIGANKSAEALFGNERSHMIGMAFVDLLAPESHRSALDYLDGLSRNALSSVLNDGREVIGRVAGGGLVPLFMTVGRVSTTKFCAVLRDITQWKRAEEELTSAKKAAENASSQKSDFLAKMSHEIRTPLNAIIGFSEVMMEERFGSVGNDRYKEYLRDIHVSGTHIMSLVNDLLDLSKIEAGKLELTFEAVGLNDVVRECAALMQPQANRERIIIRTSLSSSLPPVVADNRSLRQITLNLLSNAVKFNSAGGQVIVSTLYEESGEVVLRVRDTGQGMSEGDIVKAMEPFRQLSTSRTGGGTGLGLPLTKALVEANRAAFQIDSAPGQGTMIQITFPSTRVLAE